MNSIMLDLETLGTGDNAAIIQIGAVRFGTAGLKPDNFARQVDWNAPHFGNIEPDTLQWWLEQDPVARTAVFSQANVRSLRDCLIDLDAWIAAQGPFRHIWACPPNFDLRLLRQACARCGVVYPFPFWKERDFRTIRSTVGVPGDVPKFLGIKHHALDDARFQAEHLINILKRIRPTATP